MWHNISILALTFSVFGLLSLCKMLRTRIQKCEDDNNKLLELLGQLNNSQDSMDNELDQVKIELNVLGIAVSKH